MDDDPYEVLGVSRTAPDSVIKAAYKARIRETHPDNGGDPAAAQAVNDAYAALTDPDRRARLDQQPRRSTPPPAPAPEPAAGPPSSPQSHQSAPTPVYATHDLPPSWWKWKTAWIPAAAALALAAASGPVALAAVTVGLVVSARASGAKILIGLALAVAAAVVPADVFGMPEWLHAEYAAVAFAVTLIFWAFTRRSHRRAVSAHLGDIFTTTQSHYDLTSYVVESKTRTGEGMTLVHLFAPAGPEEWPLPTARDNGMVNVGDYVLVHQGRIVASATADMLLAAARAR